MFKRFFIFLIFAMSFTTFSQQKKFSTHSTTLKGELTKEDIYEKDFGRFDAYELQMEDGDFIIMKLNASFFPLMTVVSPSSEYQIAFPLDSNPEVVFKQEIAESGLWQIYIAGDSTDFGEHSLKLCYVSQDTRNLPADTDYCTLVHFFLAHSETNFFYFREENCELNDGTKKLKMNSQGLFESGEIVTKDEISKLTIVMNENDSTFQNISEELKGCLKKDWNIRKSENKIEFKEIEGLRKISFIKDSELLMLSISTK